MSSNRYIVKNATKCQSAKRYVSGFMVKDGVRVGVKFSTEHAWIIPDTFMLGIVLGFVRARKDYDEMEIRIIKVY